MTDLDWIAVDWGTTHLRAWAMDANGAILSDATSEMGMQRLSACEFEGALLSLIEPWIAGARGPVDVVACGMVGSRQGWVEASYRQAPCKALGDVFTNAHAERLKVHVISGIKQSLTIGGCHAWRRDADCGGFCPRTRILMVLSACLARTASGCG